MLKDILHLYQSIIPFHFQICLQNYIYTQYIEKIKVK